MQNSNTQAGDMYLFTKTVASEAAIKKEFEPKGQSAKERT